MSDDDHEIPPNIGHHTGITATRPHHADKPIRRAPGKPCRDCGHPRLEHRWGSRACRRIYLLPAILGERCGCERFAE